MLILLRRPTATFEDDIRLASLAPMHLHPALTHLPRESLETLETSVRPKFNAYFEFTQNLPRLVRNTSPDCFIYPDDSVMSDLTILASLFGEIYQAFNDHSALSDFAATLAESTNLRKDFRQIVEGCEGANGSFWITRQGKLERLSTDDAIQKHHLKKLLRTLRNGFAHFHWLYTDLSALAYWQAQNWSTQGAPAEFKLNDRPPNNYMTYIADGKPPWNPNCFWDLGDLRILATPIPCLRYFLHLNLQQLLNNTQDDIFNYAK
jgi:hypothetical protein